MAKLIESTVCWDHEMGSCICLSANEEVAELIPLLPKEGLQIKRLKRPHFDKAYTPAVNWPIDKAARMYIGYARYTGATDEAIYALKSLLKEGESVPDVVYQKARERMEEVTRVGKKCSK